MTSPYVISPSNSVQLQSQPQGGFQSQAPQGGFQSFLNSLQQQPQNGMQQRRKGILGGLQDVNALPSSPMGSGGGGSALGTFAKFML